MGVVTDRFQVSTKGFSDVVDITGRVAQAVSGSGLSDGIALVFVAGSTGGVTTIEYESGAVSDLKRALEESRARAFACLSARGASCSGPGSR